MPRLLVVIVIAAAIGGSWWLWNNHHQFRDTIEHYVENGEFMTLEARYTADAIMDSHRKELLVDDQYTFQEPTLKFYPYLLIQAKYVQSDKKTREGAVLWSLTDGEMVLDTETWEKTHGFEDAINAGATRNDFKIMHALAKNGTLTRTQLQNELHLEADIFSPWIESAADKHLIIVSGDEVQLHLQNPKILVIPQTKIKQAFVTKPNSRTQRTDKQYSRNQIEKIVQAAFGPTFTIRKMTEVFLPVYSISVLNPDGSVLTSNWNALTGQQILSSYDTAKK